LLVRLLAELYFAAGLHRIAARMQPRRAPTRRERVRAQYGPSRMECLVVVLLWLLVLVLVVGLFVRVARVLDGPIVR
jgi:hypothetical protein